MKKIQWHYEPIPTQEQVAALSKQLNVPWLIAALLLQRGITDKPATKAFFTPPLQQLHDPLLMRDMEKAALRLWEAIDAQEHICVYGDYDVDGTTSVALLYDALQRLGAKRLSFYIPQRHKEGYGLSAEGVRHAIADKVDLLVCVDCGTRATVHLARCQAHGIATIVCDHHQTAAQLPPAFALLNPKRTDCTYPFKELSACGVVFKLVQAMTTLRTHELAVAPYLDLVALSIAADIVPMVGENRCMAYHGLACIRKNPRPGIAVLKQFIRSQGPLSISDLVFYLAPRINAVGRIDHAAPAVHLLLSTDQKQALQWAKKMDEHNTFRKQLDEQTTNEALAMIAAKGVRDGMVLCNRGWSKGIVGIVAARCVAHHHRPTLILTQEGDKVTGSGRSVPGFNLYEAIDGCAHLLERYGGHEQAVGLTLQAASLPAFIQAFETKVSQTLLPKHKMLRQRIDLCILLDALTPQVTHLMARMAPFGPAHPRPVFATAKVTVLRHTIYQGKHVKIFFQEKTKARVWEAIGFNMAPKFLALCGKQTSLDIAYNVSIDYFRGKERLQLTLQDIRPSCQMQVANG